MTGPGDVVTPSAAETLEVTRRTVEEAVRGHLADVGADVGADLDIEVVLLGVRDLLWREPTTPWHRDLLARTRGTLPVYLTDDEVYVGRPWTPGSRPCPVCLARRWQQLRSPEQRDPLERGLPVHAVDRLPTLTHFALAAIARLAEHVVIRPSADRTGHPYMYALRLSTLAIDRHPVVADSRCPVCATPVPDTADAARIELRRRIKPTPDTFRIRRVDEYPIEPTAHANPVCGVAGVGVNPRLVSATTANARGSIGIRGGGMVHTTYWGGHTDTYDRSALVGILEAHERITGSQPRRIGPMLVDTYENLHRRFGDGVLDPATCGLYTDGYYERTAYFVRYRPDLTVPWVWGHSLRDDRPVLVPAGLTYYQLLDQTNRFVQESSNGCASGGCIEEAVYHALMELVERDAFVISWYAKPTLTEIDPRTCASVRSRLMIERIAMYGYDVRMFDSRIEFDIPVVTAVAQRRDGGPGTLLFAAGAGLDPEEALRSGLYEIAAEVPTHPEYTVAGWEELSAQAADFTRVGSIGDHARLYGLPAMARWADHLLGGPRDPRPMAEVYRRWNARRPRHVDLADDVRWCVAQMTRAGFDTIVVDQTSPEQSEMGLHTASVIVPGLLPIDFGWERQRALHMDRTRTVLRRVGRRETDLTWQDLNLAPHPFP